MSQFSFGYIPGKRIKIDYTENVSQTIEENTNNTNTEVKLNSVNPYALKKMKREIISKVSIPMYFKDVIIPQLPGYFDIYPVNFDNDPRACCPLHDEDTPSFRYYEDTQSFYCFGCQKGGTIINLHRYFAERLNGREVPEEEAVSYLYDYFINGKNVGYIDEKRELTVAESEPIEKLNKNRSMRFSAAETAFEKAISHDNSISLEKKKELWNKIDVLDALVSLGFINYDDAKSYIENEVQTLK